MATVAQMATGAIQTLTACLTPTRARVTTMRKARASMYVQITCFSLLSTHEAMLLWLQGATKIAAKRSGLKAGMGVAGAELTEDGDDVLR